jgi:acyl CoA:acetate/3-ketoacid CoA transferase
VDKVVASARDAVADIVPGSSLAAGGFGLCGIPSVLIAALLESGVDDLEVVSNNCGVDGWGLGQLLETADPAHGGLLCRGEQGVRHGKMIKGMGGAMDIANGAKRVIVLMEHVAKDGSYKIVKECSLLYTGRGSVQRIITDLGVLDVTPQGLRLVELAPDVSDQELRDKTEPPVLGLP